MGKKISLEDELTAEIVEDHDTVSRKSKITKRKALGAYYTPPKLAELVTARAISLLSEDLGRSQELEVLDPAVGEGVFAESIINHLKRIGKIENFKINFTGIDVEERALERTRENVESQNLPEGRVSLNLIQKDFLKWKWEDSNSFDLIIGNPPWGVPNSDSSHDVSYKDLSLDFVYEASQLLSSESVLSFLLPGVWLFSRSYTKFRKLLLGLDRDIQITQISKDWFDGTYTVEPVALFIGPEKKGVDNFTFLDYTNVEQSPQTLYEIPKEQLEKYVGKRFPATEKAYHRFIGSNGPTKLKKTNNLGLKSYGGLKTYDNEKYIFSSEDAEELIKSGQVKKRIELTDKEKENGVKSEIPVLIPYGKGGKTRKKNEWTAFWAPIRHYVRWDEEAVNYYDSRNSMRNKEKYFSTGLNFSASGRNCPVFRISNGLVFDADYPFVPVEEDNLWSVLSILNSPCCIYLIKHVVNPTAHFKNQDFKDVFLPDYNELDTKEIEMVGREIFERRKSGETTPDRLYRQLSKAVGQLYDFGEREEEKAWNWFKKNRLN